MSFTGNATPALTRASLMNDFMAVSKLVLAAFSQLHVRSFPTPPRPRGLSHAVPLLAPQPPSRPEANAINDRTYGNPRRRKHQSIL
jgi:hypothetical protein